MGITGGRRVFLLVRESEYNDLERWWFTFLAMGTEAEMEFKKSEYAFATIIVPGTVI